MSEKIKVNLKVNGEDVTYEIAPEATLLQALRIRRFAAGAEEVGAYGMKRAVFPPERFLHRVPVRDIFLTEFFQFRFQFTCLPGSASGQCRIADGPYNSELIRDPPPGHLQIIPYSRLFRAVPPASSGLSFRCCAEKKHRMAGFVTGPHHNTVTIVSKGLKSGPVGGNFVLFLAISLCSFVVLCGTLSKD